MAATWSRHAIDIVIDRLPASTTAAEIRADLALRMLGAGWTDATRTAATTYALKRHGHNQAIARYMGGMD